MRSVRIPCLPSVPPSLIPYLEMRGDGGVHPPHEKREEAAIPDRKRGGRKGGREGHERETQKRSEIPRKKGKK